MVCKSCETYLTLFKCTFQRKELRNNENKNTIIHNKVRIIAIE